MNMRIRPLTPEERSYTYTQDEELIKKTGCIGHLRADMDTDGNGFFTTWDDHNAELKTQEFKREFDKVINGLRFDGQYGGLLRNRSSLSAYCHGCQESAFSDSYNTEYGFRVDTDQYSYMLRCNTNKGAYNLYCYAYVREMLEKVLLPAPEMMNVIIVEPEKRPYLKSIQTGLEALQKSVSGYIEAIYPFDDPVALIANEEGKINGMQYNRALRDEDNNIYDIVAGTFIIVGLGDEDFTSVPDELVDKYLKKYEQPELFTNIGGKITVMPMLYEKKESVLDKLAQKPHAPKVSSPKKSREAEL